ncbi:clathrin light chain A isoform X6 [Aquila chrysaetos chrysaetos]|uniref:Clathrin light chain n=1 Tax=Aquila chrysaetos chrysaetos TaxID=223781 RepID=A0A663FCE1_AQUCH|nr:clathrin light chain A isoform X6 [Aquila chrysaetos chrysaetos]
MADLELFGSQQQPMAAVDNGALDGAEEDPAAAFLAQQENEIAGIENDEGYSILDSGEVPSALQVPEGPDSGAVDGVVNGDVYQESNGPIDSYAAISQVDRLQSEPESIRKWREEQKERLEQLDANSRKQEAEWKEKAIKELEEWYARQDEKLQKTKASNRLLNVLKVRMRLGFDFILQGDGECRTRTMYLQLPKLLRRCIISLCSGRVFLKGQLENRES